MNRYYFMVKVNGEARTAGSVKADFVADAYRKILGQHGGPTFTDNRLEYCDVYDDQTFVRIAPAGGPDSIFVVTIVATEVAAENVSIDLSSDQRAELMRALTIRFNFQFSDSDLNDIVARVERSFQEQFGDEIVYIAEQLVEEQMYGGTR